MAEGWIKIHRKLQDSKIWTCGRQPFDYRSAWIDLLMMVNHRDTEVIIDYETVPVKRGQIMTSTRQLGERWNWSKNRVCKYLRLIESEKMVTKSSTTRWTLLTVENYDIYQCDQDTGVDTERTQTGHGYATNKNEKNDKNEKNINNIYTKSFSAFWECYPRKSEKGNAYKCYLARLKDGFSEEELLTACKNYAAECKSTNRDKKYIKLGSTFLSSTTPFVDYLKGETDDAGMGTNTETDEERTEQIRRYLESDEFRNSEDDSLF